MAEDIKRVIQIETDASVRTVKSLKQEISDLRDALLNVERGSEEYDNITKKLNKDIDDLNDVMGKNKKTVTALEGSYDALVQQMGELKKQWRATADEMERAKLGTQIDSINTQLKKMDASIGNNQRNVGNYTESFADALRKQNEATEQTRAKFEGISKVATGVASAYGAAQGAMVLFNGEAKTTEEQLVAIIALVQGLGGMKDLIEGFGTLKVALPGVAKAIDGVVASFKGLSMGAKGGIVGLVIAGLGLLISKISSTRKELNKLNEEVKEQKELNSKIATSVGGVAAEYNLMRREYTKLTSAIDKKKWVDDNKTAFEKLGFAVNSVNDADRIFIQQSAQVIAALRARAEAEALKERYQEEYIKAEEKKLNYKEFTVPSFSTKSADKIPQSAIDAGLTPEDFTFKWGGGQSGAGTITPTSERAIEVYRKQYEEQRKIDEAEIDKSVNLWAAKFEDAERTATELYTSLGFNSNAAASTVTTSNKTIANSATALESAYKQVYDAQTDYGLSAYEREYTNAEKKLTKDREVIDKYYDTLKNALANPDDENLKGILENFQKSIAKRDGLTQKVLDEMTKDDWSKKIADEFGVAVSVWERQQFEILDNINRKYYDITATDKLNTQNANAYANLAEEEAIVLQEIANIREGIFFDADRERKELQDALTSYLINKELDILNAEKLAIQQELALYQGSVEGKIALQERLAQVESDITNKQVEKSAWAAQQQKEDWDMAVSSIGSSVQGVSDILGNVMTLYDENSKEYKAIASMQAIIDALSAANAAYKAMAGIPTVGPALGAAAAGAALVAGYANVKKINETTKDSQSTTIPNVTSVSTPVSYTRNYTNSTDSEVEMNTGSNSTRVYVVESDITETQSKVAMVESSATF